MKKNLKQIIKENTIPWDKFTQDFDSEQEKLVAAEIKYYDVLQELKQTRKSLGLTQHELAQKANIPRSTVTKVESGSYNPTLQTLMNIAGAMNKKLQINLV